MVTTNNEELALKAKSYKNLCYGKVNKFLHEDIGFNYRLPNISAAMGYGQLQQINEIFKQKERIYNRYSANLDNVKGLHIPKIENYTTKFIMWVFNVYLDENFKITRDGLTKILKEENIDTRDAFVPINKQKPIQELFGVDVNSCPNANYIGNTLSPYLEITLKMMRLI